MLKFSVKAFVIVIDFQSICVAIKSLIIITLHGKVSDKI